MLVTFFESAPSARASRLSQVTEFLNPQPEQGEEALARGLPSRDIVLTIADRLTGIRRDRMTERLPSLVLLLGGLAFVVGALLRTIEWMSVVVYAVLLLLWSLDQKRRRSH